MGEADLARQLELYASLLRQAPYSPHVWVTGADGAAMIRYAESLGILRRQPHELGDVLSMSSEQHSVLASYFRNNALHLLLMPSLLACAFLSNATVPRADLHRLARRVYPYVADEYFLRWSEEELPAVVDELLEDLLNHGLLTANEDRTLWHRPDAESPEAVQISVLAQATVPILERYLPGARPAAQGRQRPAEPGSARAPVPADGAAYGAALRDQLPGVLPTARCSATSSPCCVSARCSWSTGTTGSSSSPPCSRRSSPTRRWC